jgi:hypothetical protein
MACLELIEAQHAGRACRVLRDSHERVVVVKHNLLARTSHSECRGRPGYRSLCLPAWPDSSQRNVRCAARIAPELLRQLPCGMQHAGRRSTATALR